MKTKSIQYPLIVWSDVSKSPGILLYDALETFRILTGSQVVNISTLIKEISRLCGIEDLVKAAEAGDEQFFPFPVSEFPDDDISWNKLLTELKSELGNFNPYSLTNLELLQELKKNYKLDLAASALFSVYNSVIYYLAKLSHELAVKSIGVSGSLAENSRFLTLLHNNLGGHYQIVLL